MQSNSKLSKAEKIAFKIHKKTHPHIKFVHMGRTTIAFKHVGGLVEFATAICGATEKKNRPKVGKYWAMSRVMAGKSVKLPFFEFDNMLETNIWY